MDSPNRYTFQDYRPQADLLREKVKNMGFYLLQKELYGYSHFDPRAEIAFVAKYCRIDRFLTVIQTHWIDGDKMMRF